MESFTDDWTLLRDVYELLVEQNVLQTPANEPIVRFEHPIDLKTKLNLAIAETGISAKEIKEICRQIIHYSVKTGHPHFYNQLFGRMDCYGLAGSWITEALNTSQYTFEVSPVFTYGTAAIMIAGNLLFIIWDEHHESIIVGRLLTSLAHGVVFVTIVRHAGENAAKNSRATILSTLNCALYFSIFMSVIVSGTVWPEMIGVSIERITGIVGLLFAVSSIVCSTIFTVETVPFLLAENKSNDALVNLKHLRDVVNETPEIVNEMEEFMVEGQNKQGDRNIFKNGNGKLLGLLIIARLLVALTNNFYLNFVLIDHSSLAFRWWIQRPTPIVVVAPRFAMAVGQIFYADYFQQRTQIIVSSILAGLTVIGFGIAMSAYNVRWYIYISIIFSVIFQFFCGIGVDQMPDVCLSEAFSTAKKLWSISFVTAVEHSFHIFMIGMVFVADGNSDGVYALLFTTGAMIIVLGLILFGLLPDTNGKTLKQAQDLYQNIKILPTQIRSMYA